MRLVVLLSVSLLAAPAPAHDIYTNLRTKDRSLPCCGGESAGASRDCWRTIYRERGDLFQFRTEMGDWVSVPQDRIQFTPIPGDKFDGEETHVAHLCYRDDPNTISNYHEHGNADRLMKTESGKEIVVYCALIPPGGL